MQTLQTRKEYDGDIAVLILAAVCCLPLGIFLYFTEREDKWICPSCRETVHMGASRCRYCDEDLTQYK